MRDFNECLIIGRFVRDPEMSYTKSGTPCISFSIASNEGLIKDQEHVNFIDCKAWVKTAELIQKFCKKGKKVLIRGQFKQERWIDKNTNQNKSKVYINVKEIVFLDGNPAKNNSESNFSFNTDAGGFGA